jgi:peptidoglycan/xylan/chitin deacetylase (PgdA/CDA1 family)
MRKTVKAAMGVLLFSLGIYRLFFRNRAVIVLFHRVDDRLRGDPLSCTVEEFVAFCRFFKRYFQVIDLPTLLDRLQRKQDISRTLVITFDDGYSDNREFAARELRKLGLPACFFVATGFIESETIPWWDQALPVRCRWMTWDDVRALVRDGFDVGAHTVNHVDLGRVDPATAGREIEESKQRLERELARPIALFAYPYGARDKINEQARDLVRQAGFRCCLSAYGGDVTPGDDPFRIQRYPISDWYTSPYQFGFETAMAQR